MKWEQVREQYPEQWVLVEAISAYSKDSIRYIEEVAVICSFTDSTHAWKEYKKLHLTDRSCWGQETTSMKIIMQDGLPYSHYFSDISGE